jgi:hypothetical protein
VRKVNHGRPSSDLLVAVDFLEAPLIEVDLLRKPLSGSFRFTALPGLSVDQIVCRVKAIRIVDTDVLTGTSCLRLFMFFLSPSGPMEYCFKSGHDPFHPHHIKLFFRPGHRRDFRSYVVRATDSGN